MTYLLSHDQLCHLNILAGKIQAVGNLLNFWEPANDFPNSDGIFMDLGAGLDDVARKINRMMTELENANIAERKKPVDLMGHYRDEIERLTSERDELRHDLREAIGRCREMPDSSEQEDHHGS
jgi:hypothetical protein